MQHLVLWNEYVCIKNLIYDSRAKFGCSTSVRLAGTNTISTFDYFADNNATKFARICVCSQQQLSFLLAFFPSFP